MRYDTPIFFQQVKSGELNVDSGNYDEDIVTEEKCFASVASTGTETLRLVYNGIKQESLTIKLLRPYKKPFDRIRIGAKIYTVDLSKRNKAFVVSEVQNNAQHQN